MKKYRVENRWAKEEDYQNGSYSREKNNYIVEEEVSADNEDDAIETAKNLLVDILNDCLNSECFAEISDDAVVVYDSSENEIERYFDFEAEVIESTFYCVEHSKYDYLNSYYEDLNEAIEVAKKEQAESYEENKGDTISISVGEMYDGEYTATAVIRTL